MRISSSGHRVFPGMWPWTQRERVSRREDQLVLNVVIGKEGKD